MVYVSIGEIVRVHFLIGVCFGIGFAAYARYKARPRVWFAFGGDALSFGDGQRWLRWYVVAFGFEILTSLAPGHTLYVELALSFVEAAALVLGAFVVDRVLLVFFEIGAPESPKPRRSIHDRLRAARAERDAQKEAERAQDRAEFDRVTRGR